MNDLSIILRSSVDCLHHNVFKSFRFLNMMILKIEKRVDPSEMPFVGTLNGLP